MRRESGRRFAVLGCVVGGHLLIALVLLHARDDSQLYLDSQRQTVLILIEAPSVEPAERITKLAPLVIAAPTPNIGQGKNKLNHIEEATTALPETSVPNRAIDWRAAGEEIARDFAQQSTQQPARPFGAPATSTPAEKSREFDWSPQPQRAGFVGPLPYLRLGKRCIIVLPFFTCAIGTLPQANGELFEDMRDPELPRSSVP